MKTVHLSGPKLIDLLTTLLSQVSIENSMLYGKSDGPDKSVEFLKGNNAETDSNSGAGTGKSLHVRNSTKTSRVLLFSLQRDSESDSIEDNLNNLSLRA